MRVVLLLGRSTGGIGTHVADLAARLRREGVEVRVVTDALTASRFDLGEDVRLWWPRLGSRRDLRPSVALVRRLRRMVAWADVVHAHGHQAGLLALLVMTGVRGRSRSPRLIVSWHNQPPPGPSGVLAARAARLVAERADLVTGASTDLVEQARRDGARRAWLAPVPSPKVPWLLAQPRGIPEGAEPPLVLTVSRIAAQKDLHVLVAAAARLTRRCDWAVVGEGDAGLLRELEASARHTGAPVRFVGAQADVTAWLRRAAVFVLTSRWEARALVVQEAMAAGVPVVATDVGGLRDLVAGAGVLVPPGDPAAVAAAVDRLLGDPQGAAAAGAAGRRAAAGWAGGHDTARQWMRWYDQVVGMT